MFLRFVQLDCHVSESHIAVPIALCQSLWPCPLAGCSASKAYRPEVLKEKPKRARDMRLLWPSGKFSPATE